MPAITPHSPTVYALVLGKLIAALRDHHGLTQAELAQRAGLTQPTLSRIERGQTKLDAYAMHAIAAQFGMTSADLDRRVEEAIRRSEQAARGALGGRRRGDWWTEAIEVAGTVGLVALIAFAVAAVLSKSE